MCGIAGLHINPDFKGKVPAGQLLNWLLIGILPRGDHATGFLSVGFDNQIQMDKAPVPATEFVTKRKSIKAEPQTILAHTRYATQGEPSDNRNNHPVNYATTFLVHNGWITNDDDLYKKYDMERHAEVDTEAIAALLWDKCEPESWDDADKALSELEGAMAIAAVDIRRPGEVLLARGFSSPLVYIEAKGFVMWASTREALKLAWGKVYGTPPKDDRFKSLNEGDILLLKNGEMEAGSFTPTYGTRFSDYNYSSSWYDKWDNSTESSYGVSGGSEGYWEKFEDGTKVFHRYPDRLTDGARRNIEDKLAFSTPYSRGTAMGTKQPWRPLVSELKKADTYLSWAKMDLEIHEYTVAALSQLVDMDEELIQWMLFHIEPTVLEGDKDLRTIRDYLDRKYVDLYDDIIETFANENDMNTIEGEAVEVSNELVPAAETMMADILRNATDATSVDEQVKAAMKGEDRQTKPYPSFDPIYACIECGQFEMEDDGYCIECGTKKEVRERVG